MPSRTKQKNAFNAVAQIALPILTISGFLLISLKRPSEGLMLNLLAQIFWIYSGYQAWRKGGQIGIFVTVVLTTVVILFGVINYALSSS